MIYSVLQESGVSCWSYVSEKLMVGPTWVDEHQERGESVGFDDEESEDEEDQMFINDCEWNEVSKSDDADDEDA